MRLSRRKLSNFATCATSCNSAIHPARLNPTFLRAPSRFLERGRIPSMHPVASEGVVAASARSVILAVYHDYTRKVAVRYVGYLAPWCHVSSLTVLCTPLAMVHFPCAILPPLGPEGVSYRDDAPRASHDSWSPISVIFCCESTRVENRGISIGRIIESILRKRIIDAIIYFLFLLHIIWKREFLWII